MRVTSRRDAGISRLALVACLLVAMACSSAPRATFLDVATTTSLKNSGLLDQLLPSFTHETGLVVRIHAAGSGRSLEMMADGVVDLALSHAPAAEARYLAEHPEWAYRKIAYNHFVVVGPPEDRAGVRAAPDAVEAFRRIAGAQLPFVSRGDGSGTHERETQLWDLAGVRPSSLLISGPSMAVALRHADDRGAYTLSDEATFWQLDPELDVVILSSRDPQLLNTYAVIHPQGNDAATRFAAWLSEGPGRAAIAAYRIAGHAAFTVWPDQCPGGAPDAALCAG